MESHHLDRKPFNLAKKSNLFFTGVIIALVIAIGAIFIQVVFYAPILTLTTFKIVCLFVLVSGTLVAIWEANIVGILLYIAGIVVQLLGSLLKLP
jgi:hypothetical protein